MEPLFVQSLFFILLLGLLGGFIAKLLKTSPLSGYVISGIVGSQIFPALGKDVSGLTQVGLILLLFSLGLELSLSKLFKVGWIAPVGAILQMFLITILSLLFLKIFGFQLRDALILSVCFSLSSTAIVVKLLEERGEIDSIQGKIMIAWLLTQDLAVIPIMALLPLGSLETNLLIVAAKSLLTSALVLLGVFFIGRLFAPKFIRVISETNSRELMLLASVFLAIGTAFLVSELGVSAGLGAFLAGIVISESQENLFVFSETRPLRDLFVILFFVTLGFYIAPGVIISNSLLILALALFVIFIKFFIIFLLMVFLGYKGKTALSVPIGLSQVGEFSFVILFGARSLNIISQKSSSLGIAVTLLTILITPFLFKITIPLWRRLKGKIAFLSVPSLHPLEKTQLENHIIICGYGRMGSWVGKALDLEKIPYLIIDYNREVIKRARSKGTLAIFADPAEHTVLDAANIRKGRALVVAIPDLITQEEVISYAQTVVPNLPIFTRAHFDKDVTTLSQLKIKKVVQPEFEAAITIVKEILQGYGRPKEKIKDRIITLRRSHSLST